MFDNLQYPKSLEEELFHTWLEKGRESKLSYRYLLIIWDELEAQYNPVYAHDGDEIDSYEKFGAATGREALVAVYDLYSESRILT